MKSRSLRPSTVIAVAIVVGLAACADKGTGGSDAAETNPAAPPTSNLASEAPEDLPRPSSSHDKGRPVVVSGTLAAGVESNCVLLGTYLLLGGPRELLRPGRKVTVTGHLATEVTTTCQQGTPLQVDRAVPTK